MIRFIDWFAGIGGFRLGLERANKSSGECGEWTRSPECSRSIRDSTLSAGNAREGNENYYKCVGACEIDKWCRRVYAKNFGHEPEWADSRAVNPASLPDFDLFCAGFPCQSFSIAGKRRGFRDIRGTLFFEIIRICGERRPRYLLLENVKGLLSVDDGFTFETILAALSDIGYDCQWEVLNSKNFGVPQNRERVFIVGHLRGQSRPQVFPIGEVTDGQGGQSNQKHDNVESKKQTQQDGMDFQDGISEARVERLDNAFRTIQGRHLLPPRKNRRFLGQLFLASMPNPLQDAPDQWGILGKASGQECGEGQTGHKDIRGTGMDSDEDLEPPVSWCWDDGASRKVMQLFEEQSPTLKNSRADYMMLTKDMRIRRLTPLECERLQGFPDAWTEEVSDTQRYRMLGNAVTVNAIKAIGQRLLEEILVFQRE